MTLIRVWRITRRLSVKRPTTKNIMQRTESESWPSKNDIVQRTSRFSKPVEKDGMKLIRNDLPLSTEQGAHQKLPKTIL